jgi:flagellar motility protein MotE (MotC chaperone)
MKPLLTALAAFLLSLVASTGVTVKLAPRGSPAAAAAPSGEEAQDSVREAVRDSQERPTGEAAPPSQIPHRAAESTADSQGTAAALPSSIAAPPETSLETPLAGHAGSSGRAVLEASDSDTASQRQVARILSQMKPADAARLVELLEDEDAERILRSLGAKPAALLLAHLPPERATALTRRLLGGATPRSKQ